MMKLECYNRSHSALCEGINNAGNSLENMIDQWEQIVMNAHLFPLVFDA